MKNKYQSPFRLGIIGCGGYGFELAKRILTLPRQLTLVAAVSLDFTGDQAAVLQSNRVEIFANIDDFLKFAPGKIDAILNPTPIHLHSPITLKCLEAGFPVWLEKPPVATVSDLDAILIASKRYGQDVHVCFNSIYGHNVQRLKAELISGMYGKVLRVRGLAGWTRTEAYYQRAPWAGKLKVEDRWVRDGTMNNPLAHLLCNNLYLASAERHALAEAESLDAYLWRGNETIESEDTSALRLLTRDGVEVISHLTLCPEEEIEPINVVDTKLATITLRDFTTVEIAWADGRWEKRESYCENRIEMLNELAIRMQMGEPPLCSLAMCRPFVDVIERAFNQVLAREGEIPLVPADRITPIKQDGSIARQINGINKAFQAAHESGKLLREIAPAPLTPVGL